MDWCPLTRPSKKPWDSLVSPSAEKVPIWISVASLIWALPARDGLKLKKWQQHTQQNCVLLSPVESSFAECDSTLIEINRSVIWSLPCPSCWKLIPSGYIRCICPAQPWATRVVPNWLVGWLRPGFWVNLRLDLSDYVQLILQKFQQPGTAHALPDLSCIPSPLLWRRTSVSQFAPGKLSSVGSREMLLYQSQGIGLASELESQHRRACKGEIVRNIRGCGCSTSSVGLQ